MSQNIISLYQSGVSMNQIVRDTSLTIRSVQKILKQAGIPRRNMSECHRKYKMDEHFLDRLDSSDKFYFLGWFASDGCIYSRGATITFQVQIDDMQILENIKLMLASEHPIKILRQAGKKTVCGKECNIKDAARLELNSMIMVKRLRELGFTSNKSEDLVFPSWITDEYLADFCRGYWEGDGSLCHHKSSYTVQIAGTFCFCSILLGRVSSKLHFSCHLENRKPTYIISINGNTQCLKFMNFIYQNAKMVLPRKHQKYLDFLSALRSNANIHNKTKAELPLI